MSPSRDQTFGRTRSKAVHCRSPKARDFRQQETHSASHAMNHHRALASAGSVTSKLTGNGADWKSIALKAISGPSNAQPNPLI